MAGGVSSRGQLLLATTLIAALAPAVAKARSDPLSSSSLMATVRHYASQPDHASGTTRSQAIGDWIALRLKREGLELGRQSYTFPRFRPTRVALSIGSTPVPSAAVAPLLYSGRTGPKGIAAPLVDGGSGGFGATAVKGKIVVVSVSYLANAVAVGLYPAIQAAREDGARALVAVSQAPGDYPRWEDVDARGGTGRLPVLIVGKRSGEQVIAAARAGATARLVLEARLGLACDTDVWGVLPGRDPRRRVIVGTPASSFLPAAAERGSGVAVLLGLARHYSRLPRAKRPETLVFLATSGHEIGFLGLPELIQARRRWFEGADAYVHLGASLGAPTMTESPAGAVSSTSAPDPSGSLYDSENPLLAGTQSLFARAGAPVASTPPHERITGEQAYAYHAGVPLVSFSGSSLFFHTAGDLPDRIAPNLLAAEANGFRRAVDTITAQPRGELRARNRQAARYGAAIDPSATLQSSATTHRHGSVRPVMGCDKP
jgi:PA domain